MNYQVEQKPLLKLQTVGACFLFVSLSLFSRSAFDFQLLIMCECFGEEGPTYALVACRLNGEGNKHGCVCDLSRREGGEGEKGGGEGGGGEIERAAFVCYTRSEGYEGRGS